MARASFDAVPETCGLLDEPPRVPPAAVGAATHPPPPDPYSRRLGRTRRIALALLAIVLAMTGLPLASSPSATRSTITATLAAVSVDAGLQAVTGTAHPWREVVGPAALRFLQGAAALPQTLSRRRAPLTARRPLTESIAVDEQTLNRRRS